MAATLGARACDCLITGKFTGGNNLEADSMENDDRQVGHILNRREALALLRAAGAAMLVACWPRLSGSARTPSSVTTLEPSSVPTQAPSAANTVTLSSCIVSPEQTEGPYFVDSKLNRSDIRSDPSDGSVKEGVPLQLTLRVSEISSNNCTLIEGAIVDIWQCDALGIYSDVQDNNELFDTSGKKFLRGYQVTNANGTVQFSTIYPGWYRGRTVHIHFKVRTDLTSGQSYEFTSQLYFNDSITDRVHAQEPYTSKGQRAVKNDQDGIFQNGGNQLMLSLVEASQGYAATFDIGLIPTTADS